jgi:hypothetical protein
MRDVVLVSEQELKRMRAMLERDLSLALSRSVMAFPNRTFEGHISTIASSVDRKRSSDPTFNF